MFTPSALFRNTLPPMNPFHSHRPTAARAVAKLSIARPPKQGTPFTPEKPPLYPYCAYTIPEFSEIFSDPSGRFPDMYVRFDRILVESLSISGRFPILSAAVSYALPYIAPRHQAESTDLALSAWNSSTFSALHSLYLPLCRAALNRLHCDGVTMSGDDFNADDITAEGGRA